MESTYSSIFLWKGSTEEKRNIPGSSFLCVPPPAEEMSYLISEKWEREMVCCHSLSIFLSPLSVSPLYGNQPSHRMPAFWSISFPADHRYRYWYCLWGSLGLSIWTSDRVSWSNSVKKYHQTHLVA